MARKFTIDIHSGFAELWRYNISAMCGGFDASGERCDFVSAASDVAPVGANLKEPPAEAAGPRDLRISTAECDSIVAYVYVIPHTLPVSRDVDDFRPFTLDVKVSASDGSVLYDVAHKVNQRSGASIEIKLPQAKTVSEV